MLSSKRVKPRLFWAKRRMATSNPPSRHPSPWGRLLWSTPALQVTLFPSQFQFYFHQSPCRNPTRFMLEVPPITPEVEKAMATKSIPLFVSSDLPEAVDAIEPALSSDDQQNSELVSSLGEATDFSSPPDEQPPTGAVEAPGAEAIVEDGSIDDPKAQYEMAHRYSQGDGLERDNLMAGLLFLKAAQGGSLPAHIELSDRFESGLGLPQSFSLSFSHLETAAKQGDAEAQFRLGNRYDTGRTVSRSDERAAAWFQRAAEQGHVESQFLIGNHFETGIGVPLSQVQAYQWFRKAADHGHVESAYRVGLCLIRGLGASRDPQTAAEYFAQAGRKDHSCAQAEVAEILFSGDGSSPDFAGAVEWARMAAEKGVIQAEFRLGYCLERGLGVMARLEEAASGMERLPRAVIPGQCSDSG